MENTIGSSVTKHNFSNKLLTGILLSSILLMAALVSYPHQLAYAHDSAWHDFCFEETTLAFDFLPDLVPFFLPFLKVLMVLLAAALGITLVTFACNPQVVPPQALSTEFRCNTIEEVDGRLVGGFRGDPENSNEFFDDTNRGQIDLETGQVTKTLGFGGGFSQGLFVSNVFDNTGTRVGVGVIHFVSPLLPLLLILGSVLLDLIPGIGFLLSAIAGYFDYKWFMEQADEIGGHATHPTKEIDTITSNPTPDDFYALGANTIKFTGKDSLGYHDSAEYKFNVVDNGAPDIDFLQDPVTIEANAHFGFKANPTTLGNFGIINGTDDCDPQPKITYVGKSFYPLKIITGNQNATWQVDEHVQGYKVWEEDPKLEGQIADVFGEIPGDAIIFEGGELFLNRALEDKLKEKNISKHFFKTKVDRKIKQQQALVDKIDLQIKAFKGNTIPEAQFNKAATLDSLEKKKIKEADRLKKMKDPPETAVSGKIFGSALGAAMAFFSEATKTSVKQVDDNSNLFVQRNQTVIVVDTLPPDILVLEHLAIEVPLGQQNATDVTVLTPLVFDIADPLPTLASNATGTFEISEGNSIVSDFPLGVTRILWNATDFSGNKSPFATQIVNVKQEGTNIESFAFNQTVPLAFTDLPVDIPLSATNPDEDPLTFLIEENPEKGVILSPIEAIFQNKFQLKGTVSKLQGITADSNELVYLTDAENDRILSLDSNGVLDVAFNTTRISESPEAISLIGSDRFLISDWTNQTISETDLHGELLDKIDLSSLFTSDILSEPRFLDKINQKIYITDSNKGSLVIVENEKAFASPTKLKSPTGLAIIEGNSLFVSDSGNNRILEFDDKDTFVKQFGEAGENNGEFSSPNGISVNGTKLFVSDTDNHRIQVFENGAHLYNIGNGTEGSQNNELSYPRGVMTNNTNIFVADTNNHRIQIFNSSGSYESTIGLGIDGNGTNQFSFPERVATNNTHIFVADTNNHRIQIFNSSLNLVFSLGSGEPESTSGNFDSPTGIFINGTNVLVADSGNDRIQIFNSSGQFKSEFGSTSILKNPSDVVINHSEIYVSDPERNRIQIFDSQGTLMETIDSKISSGVSKQVKSIPLFVFDLQADSLDFDSDDNLLVGDWNKMRIVKFIPGGGEISELDLADLFDDGTLMDPKNIAINSTDFIYITDESEQEIDILTDVGNHIGEIDLSGKSIKPNGIAIDENDNIFVSDWTDGSEKIIQIQNNGVVDKVFELKNVFTNPQDIAYNGTHYWIIDDRNSDDKKIIQIAKDKGIEETFDLSSSNANSMGISFRSNSDTKNVLFTNQTSGKIFDLDTSTDDIIEFADIGGDTKLVGITQNTQQSKFLGQFIVNGSGNMQRGVGMTIGPDLNFYISNTVDNSIKKFNGTTGEYIGDFVDPEKIIIGESLSYPRDLIFGPDSNLYVASFDTDSIKKFNGITGEYIGDFVTPSSGGLDGPVGLVFHPVSGDLLVSSGINNNILKFNGTDGSLIDPPFVASSQNGGLENPQTIAIGPDGNLYAVSKGTGEILRFDITDGGFMGNFTSQNILSEPIGLAFDFNNGFLYSTTQGEFFDEIIKFNATTGELIDKISNGEVDRPYGLAVDLDSNVYALSFVDNAVFRYGLPDSAIFLGDWTNNDHKIIGLDSMGQVVPMIGFTQNDVNLLKNPGYMATDSLGDIWVTEVQGNKGKLVKFDGGTGTLRTTLDLSEISLEPIVKTMNATLNNGTKIKIDSQGNIVSGDKPPKTKVTPEGLTIDSFDNLYVGDWKDQRILKLSFDGSLLDIIRLNSTFNDPQDILIEETGEKINIFVSDKKSGDLLKINVDQALQEIDLGSNHPTVKGITNLNESVFFTSTSIGQNGKIFEVNQTNSISQVTDITIEPQGIAVIDQDSIYLSDWKDERILEVNDLGERQMVYDLGFANFLVKDKLRDIDVEEESGFVEFWIADSRKAEIQKISTQTNQTESQQSVADKFVFMSSLAVDSEDNFYVTSTENSTFNKFTQRGSLLNEVGVKNNRILIDISAQEILDSIFVYLALGNPSEIQKYDSNLVLLNNSTLNGPITSIVSSKDGDIFVGHPNNTISKFSPNLVQQTPLIINQDTSISDMIIDKDNNLFAADNLLNRIHKFNLTSADYVGWLGKCDTGEGCDLNDYHTKGFTDQADNISDSTNGADFGQFFEPSDITVDKTGNIFVADIQIKGDVNSPRIQKFSNTGYFIENFFSNSTNTLVKGNFNNTQSIAVGSNFFYVADVEKLHFFDVNPFSPITIQPYTKIASSNVTYRSNPEFPAQPISPTPATNIGFDNFQFKVTDGFDDSNVGFVNVTVASPDVDRDGIFFNVDVDPILNSVEFLDDSNLNQITRGSIINYGDQVITIQDSRDPEKGVFIQADVTPNVNIDPEIGVIRACDDSIEIHLNPGNRLNLACGNGGQVESIRGNIEVIFFDAFGRNATEAISIGNALHFSPLNFAFTAPNENNDDLSPLVKFNSKSKTYSVSPGQEVVVDTAPPEINQEVCPQPIILEAEIIQGVDSSNDLSTNHLEEINEFLDLTILDVDNGSPKMTDGKILLTDNNYTSTNQNILSMGQTTVLFQTIDDIGNKGECTSTITVQDTVSPKIRFSENIITVPTPPHDDVVIVNFDPGETYDLPENIADSEFDENRKLNDIQHMPRCILPPGSTFVLGENPIGCVASDKSENSRPGKNNFTINVIPGPSEVFIKSLNAYNKKSPQELSPGDVIRVEFSQATNKPEAFGKQEIDDIFEFVEGNGITPVSLGLNYSARYITPSLLEISLDDPTGATFAVFDSKFKIKPDSGLENAAGTFGHKPDLSPTMMGGFDSDATPIITAFLADDQNTMTNFKNGDDPSDDVSYSLEDSLIIRFSDPTNKPGGSDELSKDIVDGIFFFNASNGDQVYPGDDYVGTWLNSQTFLITVKDLNTLISNDPVPGETTVTVREDANLKNILETSMNSISTSHPLLGSFAPFSIMKKIEPEGTATTTLPSGITVEMTFPDGEELVSIGRSNNDGSNGKGNFQFLGHTIEINASDDDACIAGCDLKFTFTIDDLRQHGISTSNLRIFHDSNDNEEFEKEEILKPEITTLDDDGPFIATVTVFKNSLMGVGKVIQRGGGGGDSTSPIIQAASMGGGSIIPLEEIHFENNVDKTIIEVGEEYVLKITLYENSGYEALQHISLYTDLHGFEKEVHHSDAYVRFDQGIGESTFDPQGLFRNTDISITPNDSQLDVEFSLVFDRPMDESDLIVRAWDIKRNSVDVRFTNALEVIPENSSGILMPSLPKDLLDSDGNVLLDRETFEKWAGYSKDLITDSELLKKLGLEGQIIPEWYKSTVVEWVYKGLISFEEFAHALQYFEQQGLLN